MKTLHIRDRHQLASCEAAEHWDEARSNFGQMPGRDADVDQSEHVVLTVEAFTEQTDWVGEAARLELLRRVELDT